MQVFQIAANSSSNGSNSCDTCCCAAMSVRAGETDKISLFYAAWAMPIAGRGITQSPAIDITLLTSPEIVGNAPPVASLFKGLTAYATAFNGALASSTIDAEGNPLTFALLPNYSSQNGNVVVNANGTFTYTPNAGFTGTDRFFFSVKDAYNFPIVGEAIIAVSPDGGPSLSLPTDAMATPKMIVRNSSVSINNAQSIVSFPLEVSPQAKKGEIYRMNVRQGVSDCDGNKFYHTSCYDILIGACGA
jgi:hypothetical protein